MIIIIINTIITFIIIIINTIIILLIRGSCNRYVTLRAYTASEVTVQVSTGRCSVP